MKSSEQNTENKKAVANEIVNIFMKIKISLLIGLIWFFGFSFYNKLFQYSLFDYNFSFAEAEEILSYTPSQYYFVVDKIEKERPKENLNTNTEDNKLLDSLANTQEYKEWEKKNGNIAKNNALDNEIHTGSMKISDDGRLEVKKEIILQLFENSTIFTFIMIGITFIVLMTIYFLNKVINWTKKYAD